MKHLTVIFLAFVIVGILSCSDHRSASISKYSDETGAVHLNLCLDKSGQLSKTTVIKLKYLFINLSSEGLASIHDTLILNSDGNERTTERTTYTNLASWINGESVKWTLSIKTEDENGKVVHSGDTVFTLVSNDTIDVTFSLLAQYSMLTANFFPIRDSVTQCELQVDGYTIADTSFSKQALIGDTVTLSFDYLSASKTGIDHDITLNVYGELAGFNTLLYTGNTIVAVKSGNNQYYKVFLKYVGPDTLYNSANMVVTIGNAKTVSLDGILLLDNDTTIEGAKNKVEYIENIIGAGDTTKNSKYVNFILPDDEIDSLATLQHTYKTDTSLNKVTIEEFFNIFKMDTINNIIPENILFSDVLTNINDQVLAAHSDPDDPNNALLVSMASDFPSHDSIPVFNENTEISPIQAYLFSLWLLDETTYGSLAKRQCVIDSNNAGCYVGFTFHVIGCIFTIIIIHNPVECIVSSIAGLHKCLEK